MDAQGAGDAAYAGFLHATLAGGGPDEALAMATAVAAASTERVDPVSGIPSPEVLEHRMSRGWESSPTISPGRGWTWVGSSWAGPPAVDQTP